MKNIKISIIVPIYQAEKHLEKCLDSILCQTYTNLEIILVNDGSTDESPFICEQYKNKDERINVIHKENGGASSARNLGINIASGDYICFIDSDDWIERNMIEQLVRDIESHDLDCIGFNYLKEYENETIYNKNFIVDEKIYVGDDCQELTRKTVGLIDKELKFIEGFNFLASSVTKIYKKSILQENNIQFVDIRKIGSFEDGLFNIAFFAHCTKFQYKNEYYYHYRKTNQQSITSSYRKDMLQQQLMQLNYLKELIDFNACQNFLKAYENRIAFMAVEYFINSMTNSSGFRTKYKEMKKIFKIPAYSLAIKKFSLKHLTLKWKLYYFFIKKKIVIGLYILSFIILKIKNNSSKKR